MSNVKVYETLYQKELSPTQKIVAHVISFGSKNPVLAVQHIWRDSEKSDWKFGKMAVLTSSILSDLLKENVFNKAQQVIKENS